MNGDRQMLVDGRGWIEGIGWSELDGWTLITTADDAIDALLWT
jgi:hypothetical protein